MHRAGAAVFDLKHAIASEQLSIPRTTEWRSSRIAPLEKPPRPPARAHSCCVAFGEGAVLAHGAVLRAMIAAMLAQYTSTTLMLCPECMLVCQLLSLCLYTRALVVMVMVPVMVLVLAPRCGDGTVELPTRRRCALHTRFQTAT